MKVLWVCNIELPIISEFLGSKKSVVGGWLDLYSRRILDSDENSLFVVYPSNKVLIGEVKNLSFHSFKNNRHSYSFFKKLLLDFKPDVVHFWGTEFEFTHFFIEMIKNTPLIDRSLISIQGLVSVYAKHYFAYLPLNVLKPYSFIDIIKNRSITKERNLFKERGLYEIQSIQNIKNVIGRTSWDFATTKQINSKVNYFFCNEIMRDSFYHNVWDSEHCETGNIFVTQYNYPIKGFHIVLEAIYILRIDLPFIKISTTGMDVFKIPFFKLSSYQKYIKDLIIKYGLQDRVIFLGTLDEENITENLKKANIFVLPSVIENSSNSLGEAMLLGIPVIAAYVGGNADFINHNRNGFMYPADEPYMLAYYISVLLKDKQKSLSFSKESRVTANEKYSQEKNLIELLKIYDKLRRLP